MSHNFGFVLGAITVMVVGGAVAIDYSTKDEKTVAQSAPPPAAVEAPALIAQAPLPVPETSAARDEAAVSPAPASAPPQRAAPSAPARAAAPRSPAVSSEEPNLRPAPEPVADPKPAEPVPSPIEQPVKGDPPKSEEG